jgi:nucleotide-binding universal stress UspA family protein
MEEDIYTYRRAIEDFKRARNKAAMQRFWSSIKGESLDLMPYAEISAKLRAVSQSNLGLQDVPLKQIVGSVGRNDDFDRYFNPLRDSDRHRWASVKTVMTSPTGKGVPPVLLYKIGEMYFVLDGNHRVSIAKEIGSEMIEAYVTEVKTKVPLGSTLTPQELISKAAYADFLEATNLDNILPGIDFSLNFVENYSLLIEHIEVHRYYMGAERGKEVIFNEAAMHWFDQVYQPVAEAITTAGLIQTYRNMTLTDLYLYILDQQSNLQRELGTSVKTENAIDYLALQDGKLEDTTNAKSASSMESILNEPATAKTETTEQGQLASYDCMFRDILVGVGGFDPDWVGLEQAILMNRCSEGNIRGVYIASAETHVMTNSSEELRHEFHTRLDAVGMQGKLTITSGVITKKLQEQSLLSDLLVLRLRFPPTGALFDRSGSGLVELIQHSRRPIMLVKEKPLPITNMLLLYDGQPTSKEALYVAAYYASRLHAKLAVFTLDTGVTDLEVEASFAKTYLRKLGVDFSYEFEKGDNFAKAVQAHVEKHQSTTLLAGGYSGSSWFGRLFGSSLDTLLGLIDIPMLICK